jgi:hypothetical protein
MFLASRQRPWLATHAAIVLVVLAIAAVAHFGHHLLDPHCDSGPGPNSGPCASCSVIHGGALAENAAAVAPCAPVRHGELALPEVLAPVATVPADCAPRAPPLA